MRKFRCPHCGEKTLSFFLPRPQGISSINYNYIRICSACNRKSRQNYNYKRLALILGAWLPLVFGVILGFITDSYILLAICAALVAILSASIFLLRPLYETVAPLDVSNGQKISGFLYRVPHPNASFELNCSAGIHTLLGYGIKFDNETEDKKFHERFKDGLVPVVFHEKRKGSNAFEVRIIDKEFVPEELLHVGSEFLVEDNNQFICRGKVTGVFEVGKQDS